jgi:predicted aspartyl protease
LRCLVLIFSALLWFAPPTVASADDCPPRPLASVVLSLGPNGIPIVPVELNGTGKLLMLDTGAPLSVLREAVVEQLGLPRFSIPLDMIKGVGGRPFEQRAVAEMVRFGEVEQRSISFLIEPRSHAPDPDNAGLVGADMFSRYDLALDFPGHRLSLFQRGSCPPALPSGDRLMVQMAIRVLPSGHVLVPVALDGKLVEALLDTGASNSVLTLDAAHRLFGVDENSPGLARIGEIIGADGGRLPAYARHFKTLALGTIKLNNPTLELMPNETNRIHRVIRPGSADADEQGIPDLILGMDQLHALSLYIAYGDRVLYAFGTDDGH